MSIQGLPGVRKFNFWSRGDKANDIPPLHAEVYLPLPAEDQEYELLVRERLQAVFAELWGDPDTSVWSDKEEGSM
jgi:hypothetical protein